MPVGAGLALAATRTIAAPVENLGCVPFLTLLMVACVVPEAEAIDASVQPMLMRTRMASFGVMPPLCTNALPLQYVNALARAKTTRDHANMDNLSTNLDFLMKERQISANALSDETGTPGALCAGPTATGSGTESTAADPLSS